MKCLTFEDGTNTLSRNVDDKIPICDAEHRKTAKISNVGLFKSEDKGLTVFQKVDTYSPKDTDSHLTRNATL